MSAEYAVGYSPEPYSLENCIHILSLPVISTGFSNSNSTYCLSPFVSYDWIWTISPGASSPPKCILKVPLCAELSYIATFVKRLPAYSAMTSVGNMIAQNV